MIRVAMQQGAESLPYGQPLEVHEALDQFLAAFRDE